MVRKEGCFWVGKGGGYGWENGTVKIGKRERVMVGKGGGLWVRKGRLWWLRREG